jgi:hypothetical protein
LETEVVNQFVVLQFLSGKLEVFELAGADPVEFARSRTAFLVAITGSKSRAEFILSREQNQMTTSGGVSSSR